MRMVAGGCVAIGFLGESTIYLLDIERRASCQEKFWEFLFGRVLAKVAVSHPKTFFAPERGGRICGKHP
jgi:hypothetical protein